MAGVAAGPGAAWPHGTLAGYQRHKRVGENPCQECVDGARAAWRVRARQRFLAHPDNIRAAHRRSWRKAVRCVVCGRVVKAAELVRVRPLRGDRDRALPCHGSCAADQGRAVLEPPTTASESGAVA
jgi:hypothetical protein